MFNLYCYESRYKGTICHSVPNIDGFWDVIGIYKFKKYFMPSRSI